MGENVLLPLTHSSDSLSWSVCTFIFLNLIHLPPLASGARMLPLIYSTNKVWPDRRPRPIWCYKLCSNDRGLWCWDATTQPSRDALLQRWGRRGVLSFGFEVRVHEGRVTLLPTFFWGIRVPNRCKIGDTP